MVKARYIYISPIINLFIYQLDSISSEPPVHHPAHALPARHELISAANSIVPVHNIVPVHGYPVACQLIFSSKWIGIEPVSDRQLATAALATQLARTAPPLSPN
jgi:hypothetical protein